MFSRFFASILMLVVFFLGLNSPAFSAERRIALVIGNAKYKEAPLSNPVNDANDMEAALKSSGFRVIKAIDATQKQMNRAISEFGELLTHDSVALFYYAGHGLQVRGKNYLIPIDAEIKSESSVRVESVDVDGVLDQLSNSELNVVILDACRNNPFERRTSRSLGSAGGLAQMEAPKGSMIAYSTAPGKTAADGDGRNGLYTQALLRYIKEPGLTIEQVFKNVRREVARSTRDAQMPWESSSMTGEFYFSPNSRPSVALNPQVAGRPPERVVAAQVPAPAKVQEVIQIAKQVPQDSTGLAADKAASAVLSKPKPDPMPVSAAAEVTLPAKTNPSADAYAESKDRVIKTDSFTATGKLSLDRSSGAMTGDGLIEWANGDRYEGSMLAGRKHGKGVFTWQDGQRYDGEWSDDMINGVGSLYYTNGDRYEGSFSSGEPHGTGTYTLRNGDVYVGAWVAGNKHGQGRLTWSNGDYWEGEFRDDQQTSNGKLMYGQAPAENDKLGVVEKGAAADKATAADKVAPRKKGK
ncbi:MAG: hypothetical protein RLZZ298_860 [Pseudomonadota bacterium]|jgi:hypothetical protein